MTPADPTDVNAILRQQETLRQIIESISSELELRPLLTSIVQHACELLGADRGTIGLVDEERHVIRTEAVYKMPPDELGAEMAVGVGLAGKVLASQDPLIVNRYGDIHPYTQSDLIQHAVIRLPNFWRERMIGFFGLGAAPPAPLQRARCGAAKPTGAPRGHRHCIVAQLLFLESENPEKDIFMYINSPGGVVTAGLSVYDTMQYIKPKVATLCIGQACSMGSLLLTAGEAGMRYATPNARIMIHQPGGFRGQASDIEIHAQEILSLRRKLNDMYVKHTGQNLPTIEKAMERDNFMSAEAAQKFGLIDEIVANRSDAEKNKK